MSEHRAETVVSVAEKLDAALSVERNATDGRVVGVYLSVVTVESAINALRLGADALSAAQRLREKVEELIEVWEDVADFDYDNGNIHAAASIQTCAQQLAALLADRSTP